MNSKKILSLDEYAQKLSHEMVSEILKFRHRFIELMGTKDKDQGTILAFLFLQEFIFRIVVETLERHTQGSDRERYTKTSEDFNKLKLAMQDSIANGFSDAVLAFSGKYLDYHCSIKPVPDPESKLIN